MQVPTVGPLVAVTLCALFTIQFKDTLAATPRRPLLVDPQLATAVLEEVSMLLRHPQDLHKRRVDLGYSGRYSAGNSVGSKLLALKSAADWNNPGRKRRDADLLFDQPEESAAAIEALIDYIRPESAKYQKRRADLGYSSRYGAAASIGSKLMALKTAADWNSPGRRKRELDGQELHEQYFGGPLYLQNPDLILAVLEEVKDLCLKHQNLALVQRGVDVGYGGRYDAASSVGSKLLALKQATDSSSPGKRAIKKNKIISSFNLPLE